MCHTKIKFLASVISGLLIFQPSFAKEIVYLKSTEPCQLEAYPAPEASPLSEKLSCGEKATVLERRGPSVRVQIGKDKVVWVLDKNTTLDAPAELEVLRLMEYQEKIEAELAVLNEKVKALSETSEKLINALIAAEAGKKKK